jgi:hypothetical protein
MADFVENEDQAFSNQLTAHATALGTHGTTLGFSSIEITAADDDAKLFKYILERQGEVQAFALEFTGYKNLARYGRDAEVLTGVPVMAAFPVSPTITGANIEARFASVPPKLKAL